MPLHYRDRGVGLSLCPLPCREISLESKIITKHRYDEEDLVYGLRSVFRVEYKSKRVTTVTEIPVYTSDNFFSDVGSWLGLLVGMSLLSVVEIATFLLTTILERC